VDHGALFGGQFTQRPGERMAEGLFIRIGGWGKGGKRLHAERFMALLPRGAAAHQVNGGIVGEAEEITALGADFAEQPRLPGELDEQILQQVARVGVAAGEVRAFPFIM
jgi:hypothetical protein